MVEDRQVNQPPIIGLIGGIGSGKSTVANILAGCGCVVRVPLRVPFFGAESIKKAKPRDIGTYMFFLGGCTVCFHGLEKTKARQ